MYDPIAKRAGSNVGGWSGYVCPDWSHFRQVFWASTGCLCIIDEAADVFREHRAEALPMLTRGRHSGHSVVLIAQRHKILDRTARDQCSMLYAFAVGGDDARELAEDWAEPALARANELPKLHYYAKRRMEPVKRGVVTF